MFSRTSAHAIKMVSAHLKPVASQFTSRNQRPQIRSRSILQPTTTTTTIPTTSARTMATTTGLIGSSISLARLLSASFSTSTTPTNINNSNNDSIGLDLYQSPLSNDMLQSEPEPLDFTSPLVTPHRYKFESNHKFPTPTNFSAPSASPLQTVSLPHLPRVNDKLDFPWGLSYDKIPDDIKRVIVVGDIHGCFDELIQLLESVDYNVHEDMLISLGDIVGKGPKQTQVIDFFYNLQRYVVENIDNKNPNNSVDPQWCLPTAKHLKRNTKAYKLEQFAEETGAHGSTAPLNTCLAEDSLIRAPIVRLDGLRKLFQKQSRNTFQRTLELFKVDPRYSDSAHKLHSSNSRVFVTMANHDKFILGYLDYLHTNNLMPEEAPSRSYTHAELARDLFTPNPTTKHLYNNKNDDGTDKEYSEVHNAYITSRNHQLDPPKLKQLLEHKERLYHKYTSPAHAIQAATRLEWLRAMPNYLFLPQMNLSCLHAGVPPDLCMLFPKLRQQDEPHEEQPTPLDEIKQGDQCLKADPITDASLCPTPYPKSITDYYTPEELPKQTDYMSKLIQSLDLPMFLNARSVLPLAPKKAQKSDRKYRQHGERAAQKVRDDDQIRLPPNKKELLATHAQILNSAHSQFELRPKLAPSTGDVLPWSKAYSNRILNHKFNHPEDKSNYPHILFGHDAVNGLQLEPYASGLDTGCCYGGKLSSLVFHIDPRKESQGFAPNVSDSRLEQILDPNDNKTKATSCDTDNLPTITVPRSGLADLDLPLVVGRYPSQREITIPMDLSNSIHIEQPVLVQVDSLQPSDDSSS